MGIGEQFEFERTGRIDPEGKKPNESNINRALRLCGKLAVNQGFSNDYIQRQENVISDFLDEFEKEIRKDHAVKIKETMLLRFSDKISLPTSTGQDAFLKDTVVRLLKEIPEID